MEMSRQNATSSFTAAAKDDNFWEKCGNVGRLMNRPIEFAYFWPEGDSKTFNCRTEVDVGKTLSTFFPDNCQMAPTFHMKIRICPAICVKCQPKSMASLCVLNKRRPNDICVATRDLGRALAEEAIDGPSLTGRSNSNSNGRQPEMARK